MRSILFALTSPSDCRKLVPTIDVEYIPIRFMEHYNHQHAINSRVNDQNTQNNEIDEGAGGNDSSAAINLWDCGGQENMMMNYLKTKRSYVFSQVTALVYVFDVSDEIGMNNSSDDYIDDLRDFNECLQALGEYSSNYKVFCLLHKTDMLLRVGLDEREKILLRKEKEIKAVADGMADVTCFRTSIWDETLYRAWGSILNTMISNINLIRSKLEEFAKICGAEEVVLFEKSTFLVVAQWSNENITQDDHRFEKIANITKHFKLSCSKSQHSQLSSMELVKSDFSAFFEEFTPDTIIMVIMGLVDSKVESEVVRMNIKVGRKMFATLE